MIDVVVKESWTRILDRLRVEIGDRFYAMWFERSSVISLKRGVLAIGVPNLFIREWVEDHYGDALERIATEDLGAPVRVAIKVDPDLFREMRQRTEKIEEVVDADPEGVEGKTLEGYLELPGNHLAIKALRHVAAGGKPTMNPLLIVGAEGTGKSHLAASVSRLFPSGTKVYRVTGEDFARRFAWNLKTRKIDEFRELVASARVVILDDIQDLAGKMATQRELTSLSQDLVKRGGQLIAFSTGHPKDIDDFDPGFASILLSGMFVNIEVPSPGDMIRVLGRLLRSSRRKIPDEVIALVVEKVPGSVKRLDRLIRKIYAFAGLTGEPVDAAFLDRHLAEIAGPTDPMERRMHLLLGAVQEFFSVDRDSLLSKRKTKALALPRGVAVYLLREHAGLTFKEIGKRLGDRSHTSVFLMFQKTATLIQERADLSQLVKDAGRRLMTAGAC